MRYLLILSLLLCSCGYGWWQGDGETLIDWASYESRGYEVWGGATVDHQPRRTFIRIQRDAPDLVDAIVEGLRERGDTHGEELRVLEEDLWEPAIEAVLRANEQEGHARWPAPVPHLD